jgi:hypothetical protein
MIRISFDSLREAPLMVFQPLCQNMVRLLSQSPTHTFFCLSAFDMEKKS